MAVAATVAFVVEATAVAVVTTTAAVAVIVGVAVGALVEQHLGSQFGAGPQPQHPALESTFQGEGSPRPQWGLSAGMAKAAYDRG